MRIWLLSVVLVACVAPSDPSEVGDTEQPATATTPALALARTFVTDGPINGAVSDGSTLYLGGSFHAIGQRSGQLALVTGDTGARDKSIAELGGGAVLAVADDGSGGYFVGGDFRTAGTITTRALAHLRADGTYDPAWAESINGEVFALARDATRLYIGGSFTTVNGSHHGNFAAFDLATGALVADAPDMGNVHALAVSGSYLYYGVDNEGPPGFVARLDLPAMTASSWTVGQADGAITSLVPAGSQIYVGGTFQHLGSAAHAYVAEIDQTTAAIGSFAPAPDGGVIAMQLAGSTLYLGGQFATVGGQPRTAVAAVDASTGAVLPLQVAITATGTSPFVESLLATPSALYVGGYFDRVAAQPRKFAAAIDPTTGALLAWNARATDQVQALAARGDEVVLGGQFTCVGASARAGLAAIDLSTGRATAWAPALDDTPGSTVWALGLRSSTVWIGGTFTAIDGQPRANLAAVSTAGTGAVLPFRADTNGMVETIAPTSARLYLGGTFTTVGGTARAHLAAVDPTSGAALAWNPGFGGEVKSVVVAGPRLYAGGFGTRLGAWDVDGVAQPVPAVDGEVDELAYDGTTVYVAGFYATIGGASRNSLAATLPGTATVTTWDPAMPASRRIDALGVSAGNVYTDDTGTVRVFSKASGALETFSPRILNGAIRTFIPQTHRLLATGSFANIASVAQSNVAEFAGTP